MTLPQSEEEVLQWLPEIDAIGGDLRDVVLELFYEHLPAYFWVVRASESHHPPDHRGQHGLVIHQKRAFCAWIRLERMLKELSLIDSFEANCGRAAILAHDAFKYGKADWSSGDTLYHQYVDDEYRDLMVGVPKWADREHGAVAANYIDEHFDVPPELIRCIKTHNGGWTDDPNPETPLELGHHLADAMGSDSLCMYRIFDPEGVFTEHLKPLSPIADVDGNAYEDTPSLDEL